MKKRIISIFLFTTIIFSGVLSPLKTNVSFIDNTLRPQKAEAVFGVGDIVTDIVTNIYTGLVAAANFAVKAYEFALPALEYMADLLAKQLIHQVILKIQNDLVSWIQNDFNGQPRFIENPGSVLSNAATEAARQVVLETSGKDICSTVYSANFKAKLSGFVPGYTKVIDNTCTFDTLKKNLNTNVESFKKDFSKGGMQLYASLLEPQNNFYGMEISLTADIQDKQVAATEAAKNDITVNAGYKSQEECLAWTVYMSTKKAGTMLGETKKNADGKDETFLVVDSSVSDYYKESMDGIVKAFNSSATHRKNILGLGKDASSEIMSGVEVTCNKSRVLTPGKTIGDMATKALGLKQDSIVNANDVSGLISAVIDALTTKVIETGLRKVSGIFTEGGIEKAQSDLSGARDNINNLGSWAETQGKGELEKMYSEFESRYAERDAAEGGIESVKGDIKTYRNTLEDILTCYASSSKTSDANYIWAKNLLNEFNDPNSDIRKSAKTLEQATDNGIVITRGVGSLWKTDQMIAAMTKNGGSIGKTVASLIGGATGYADRLSRTCSTQICMAEKINLQCIVFGMTTKEGEGDTLVAHYAIEKDNSFLQSRLSSNDMSIVNANICSAQRTSDYITNDPGDNTYGPYKFKDLFGGDNGISLVQLRKFHEEIDFANISSELGCGESCALDETAWWQDEILIQYLTEYVKQLTERFNKKYNADLVKTEQVLRSCKGETFTNPDLSSPKDEATLVKTAPTLSWKASNGAAYYVIKIGPANGAINATQWWNSSEHTGIGLIKHITGTSFTFGGGVYAEQSVGLTQSDQEKMKRIIGEGFLKAGTKYFWTVQAFSAKDEPASGGQVWSFTTLGE